MVVPSSVPASLLVMYVPVPVMTSGTSSLLAKFAAATALTTAELVVMSVQVPAFSRRCHLKAVAPAPPVSSTRARTR